MKPSNELSIYFNLRKVERTSKNEKFPIYCRVSLRGERMNYSTKLMVELKYWCKLSQRVKTGSREHLAVNNQLNTLYNKITTLYSERLMTDKDLDIDEISELIFERRGKLAREKKKNENPELRALIERYLEDINARFNSKLIAHQTLKSYKSSTKTLLEFIKMYYGTNSIRLDKIDRGFFSEFESFLMVQRGLNENTANKVAKHFDRFICYAYERDWILEKPRFKVTLKYRNPQRIILTLDEIRQLEVQPLSNKDLDELRDCAIFQCYTGLAYSEIKALNKHHIKDIFGKKWIVMNRKKTGSEVKLVILPKALAILNKYENHSYCNENEQLLPIRSNCRYNVKLKEIQKQCGFNTKLNSHLFRHTFSSTIALSLGLPMETLSKCLGHQNLATTAIYGKILNNRIFDDFEKLEARLAVTL